MRQRCLWSVVRRSRRWCATVSISCWFALLTITPLVRASDFVEAQQDIPDSRQHASVSGNPIDPVMLARRDAMKAAAIAHADCVRTAIDSDNEVNASCAKTRTAYAAFLPQDYASLEIFILERKVQQLTAPTKP